MQVPEDGIEDGLSNGQDIINNISDGASFDGILDGFFNLIGSGGGISIIIISIIGFLFYNNYGKKTKTLKKQQKIDVKEYKETKKESLEEVKEIDNNMKLILDDIKEYEEKEDTIEADIKHDIDKVVEIINETKINNKREIKDTNSRLSNALERIRRRNGNDV